MDNHPIPQDVTGFQFKLVGSMTIKQFAYVGAGVVLAVVFFYSPLVWYAKYPLIAICASLGISLAFLPVGGRPLDLMASYFVKAILKPNQYIYQKEGGSLSFMELNLQPIIPSSPSTFLSAKPAHSENKKTEQLIDYLYSPSMDSSNPLDQKENLLINSLFSSPALNQTLNPVLETTQPIIPAQPVQSLSSTPVRNPLNDAPLNTQTNPQIINMQSANPPPTKPATILDVVPRSQNDADSSGINPSPNAQSKNQDGMGFPNLISGIVKDARGNMLTGILVEVLNKDNDSIRAFRTNSLGQFTSATQVSNGSYTITFEDPKNQHKFENVKIEANGSILPPINVVSMDAREELRKSLFG